ncbi:aminomethyltransferase [Ereboglobus sp. PH5-10]|uniref:glycine cleavage system aminomethyltransferase GcvT n=1 Tax=Ereboglobus sp. PH5-10 TaxID=2940629 RepID=UPI0024059960|nr:glycine cleavage system aminomethyltransferase GcvT [Ereboglobus sp. PH5-10]MDF9827802.1 aminomethyltransferase [Ereboglobus sp. PH5-10]
MTLQRTPLYDFHVAHGGRMVDFAGWEMPVQYKSILEEHKTVRRAAGLFDVSHMGEFDVRGADAFAFLQRLLTNDLSKMTPGRIVYSPMCYPSGGVVDDLLVYKRGDGDYFLCVNAGNIAKDLDWIGGQLVALRKPDGARYDVTVSNRSADYALLAIQGPRALEIVQSLAPSAGLGEIKYYHFTDGIEVAGVRCLVSRTGYTGEDGFELYHAPADARALADALLAAGAPLGMELAGLGARDSLRLEAGFPLYGHEITADISPLTAGLDWTVKLKKEGGFVGCEPLAAEMESRASTAPQARAALRKVVFFKTGDRRIVRAGAQVLDAAGEKIGEVLSGTLSPVLNEAIGSASVPASAALEPMFTDIRGTKIALQLVKPPFVQLKK